MSYDEKFITALQWMWGEGFLSPGGADEVAAIIGDADLEGMNVLDIGCGIGGVDAVLAEKYRAVVTGIDIEGSLVAHGRDWIAQRGLSDRVDLKHVDPGPLPFPDMSFDVVFSKDSLIHVEDKQSIFNEVFRVLKPGGKFIASDWLGNDQPSSEAMNQWLEIVRLDFTLRSAREIEEYLKEAGFGAVQTVDRNLWYRDVVNREIDSLSGDNQNALANRIGKEAAAQRLASSRVKQSVVQSGELRPTHLQALRPSDT